MITYPTDGIHLPGKVYSPSLTVDVAAGSSDTITFRGRDALAYGVTRIHVRSDSPDDMTYTAELEDEDKTLFRNINEQTLVDFFTGRACELPSPIIIPKKRDLTFTITNASGSTQTARIMLEGFVESQLVVIQSKQAEAFGFIPEIRFIYGSVETTDGTTFAPVDLTIPPGDWVFDRLSFGVSADTPTNRDGVTVRLRSGDYTVKQPATITQLRQQFQQGGTESLPYFVDDFDPFDAEVSNASGNTVDTSILIPCVPSDVLKKQNDARLFAQYG